MMAKTDLAVLILAAGKGTRMNSAKPKILHEVAGKAMVRHVLDTARLLEPSRTIVVVSPELEKALSQALPDVEIVVQQNAQGTASAVAAARGLLQDFTGDVLMLFADSPLLTKDAMARMLAARRSPGDGEQASAVVIAGFEANDPSLYGRLVVAPNGRLTRIVEAREASPEELAITLCNGGFMVLDGAILFQYIDQITNDNAKGEYYLTDIVAIANADGRACTVVQVSEEETLGVDDRNRLAQAEVAMQRRLRRAAMAGGATMIDPETVWLHHDTKLARDVMIEPNVYFGPNVEIAEGATIKAFCHLEGCVIGPGAIIGPYARLRSGTVIEAAAKIGNFVETKNTLVETGAKASHLSYLGDARIGAGANIGAGTITCNYDGFEKHRTDIGAGAFIGSNTALVAPIKIGDGAIIGAGSTVTRDVEPDALAVTRARQVSRQGLARKFRDRRMRAKKSG